MNLPFFIARRYFLSKDKKSFINIISIISMLVVAIGTMALIIVLSVFNGLEGLLRSLYGTVDPNLVISPAQGKSFAYDSEFYENIAEVEGVESVTEVLEDNVLIRYNKSQRVATVRGVSENFIDQGRLQDYIVYGDLKLKEDDVPYAVIGRGVQFDLSINPANDFYTLQLYFPDDIRPGAMATPERMYKKKNILPGSVFAIEKSYDENFVFVPIDFAEQLFNKQGERSSLELQLLPDADSEDVKQQLKATLGTDFLIRSNEELHSDLYKVLRIEKFFVFLTFSIIIAIASINIFFSLMMLALDKKKDVSILAAQGASAGFIRKIFLFEGCIVAFTGAFTGLLLGLLICYIQQEFGVISMGMQTAIMEAYPVKIQGMDILLTVFCIVVITIITAIQPAMGAARNVQLKHLQ